MVFGLLVEVVMFDILDPAWTTEIVLKFDTIQQLSLQDEMPIDQWIDLGYENHNALLNLGSLAIFSYIYLIRVIFYFFVSLYVRFTKRGADYQKNLKEKLFYGEILAILLEAYFEFLISGYLQMKAPLDTSDGEYVGIVTAGIALFLILVMVPMAFVYILTRKSLNQL